MTTTKEHPNQVIVEGDHVRIVGSGLVEWAKSTIVMVHKEFVALICVHLGQKIEPTEASIIKYLRSFGLDEGQARGVLVQLIGHVTEGTPFTLGLFIRTVVSYARLAK